jgi:hypothetical protein
MSRRPSRRLVRGRRLKRRIRRRARERRIPTPTLPTPDSGSSDSDSQTKNPFATLWDHLVTLIAGNWEDTEPQEVYNLISVSELALKKYSSKDVAKTLSRIKNKRKWKAPTTQELRWSW